MQTNKTNMMAKRHKADIQTDNYRHTQYLSSIHKQTRLGDRHAYRQDYETNCQRIKQKKLTNTNKTGRQKHKRSVEFYFIIIRVLYGVQASRPYLLALK
jgi:hypothetical protein